MISLFSGIGGLDLAFSRCGAQHLWLEAVSAKSQSTSHRFIDLHALGAPVEIQPQFEKSSRKEHCYNMLQVPCWTVECALPIQCFALVLNRQLVVLSWPPLSS